uniref:Uncharacterized protein n=1 Tax=Salix viminalis TaxID=40686 RepID=A0A6N2KQ32_SALVM
MEGFGDESASVVSPVARWEHDAWRMYRYYLDRATPHTVCRWIGTLVMVAVYCSRLYYVRGFYIIVYGLGVYVVNLLSGFLSLLVDPEHEHSDGPLLPTKCFDEFKPLIRRLPEFKFWFHMGMDCEGARNQLSSVVDGSAAATVEEMLLDPIPAEAVTAGDDWEMVKKKHKSNRHLKKITTAGVVAAADASTSGVAVAAVNVVIAADTDT